jgi:lipopolysaccharide transport system ATP-binding protein
LQDINIAVNAGEAVGIIGVNGAGKSTLLKMLAGTTQPTKGYIQITGKVAALLELGMGFHPDFSGRENVYMAGQLLGLSIGQINLLMPEIEAFAEIGDYIDQPVRVYSSGMQMRLAFSVATAQQPDVLIIDEALSVGDSYFQHKSFERIRALRKLGTTLLIVSHDKQAIQSICDRAILINKGNVAMEGEPAAVMDYYNALIADNGGQSIQTLLSSGGKVQTISGSGDACISDVMMLNVEQKKIEVVGVGETVTLRIIASAKNALPSLVVGYSIKDRLGQVVFGTNTHHHNHVISDLKPGALVQLDFCYQVNIGPGVYSITVALHSQSNHVSGSYEWRDRALMFNVVNKDKHEFAGTAWIPPVLNCSL